MTAFEIDRTSSWTREEPPCEGAYRGKSRAIDQRTFASVEEHDARLREAWADRGVDHGVNNTGIYRYFEEDAWLIDLATLDDLLEFLREHGDCVLGATEGATPTIEIYDDYRE